MPYYGSPFIATYYHLMAPIARLLIPAFLVLSILSLLFSSAIGSVAMSPAEWLAALQDPGSNLGEVIWRLRLPRAAAAWLVGALLALSGCLMQVLLRNPLADPYILGVSGGAAFATLLGMTLGVGVALLPMLTLGGALLSILLVFSLARGEGPWSGTRLLLTGVVTASGWAALTSLILAIGPDNSLRGMLFWLLGDLAHSQAGLGPSVVLLVLFVIVMLLARSLNVLAMGETTARLLGEETRRLLWLIYLLASVLTATAVFMAGPVGFVGLIVPHLSRMLVGADHRVLVPTATLFGGCFLVISDALARTVLAPRQLPVGVVTAVLGVPLFLLLLNRARLKS